MNKIRKYYRHATDHLRAARSCFSACDELSIRRPLGWRTRRAKSLADACVMLIRADEMRNLGRRERAMNVGVAS